MFTSTDSEQKFNLIWIMIKGHLFQDNFVKKQLIATATVYCH